MVLVGLSDLLWFELAVCGSGGVATGVRANVSSALRCLCEIVLGTMWFFVCYLCYLCACKGKVWAMGDDDGAICGR